MDIKVPNLITDVIPDDIKLKEPINELSVSIDNYRSKIQGMAKQFYMHIGKLTIIGKIALACNRHWLYGDLAKHGCDPYYQTITNDKNFKKRTHVLYDEYVENYLCSEPFRKKKLARLFLKAVKETASHEDKGSFYPGVNEAAKELEKTFNFEHHAEEIIPHIKTFFKEWNEILIKYQRDEAKDMIVNLIKIHFLKPFDIEVPDEEE